MNCKYCGSLLKEGAKFCPECGQIVESQTIFCQKCGTSITNQNDNTNFKSHTTSQNNYSNHSTQKRKLSKATMLTSVIAILLAIALVVVLIIPPGQNIAGVKLTNKAFSTPQEAFDYFIEGVKNGDMQKMSEAFAIEKSSKEFDFIALSNRIRAIMPATTLMTSQYSQFTSFNKVQQLSQCLSLYKQILCGLNKIAWGNPITGIDEAYINDYIKKINPDSLKNIKTSKFKDFSMADSNTHLENMKKNTSIYGADEARVYAVELECNGNKVNCDLVQVYRYGSSWYLGGGVFNIGELNS